MTKYDLVGVDGNAFSIMGYVTRAMKEVHCDRETIDNYLKDAKSSDYNHLLMVSMEMIQFCNEQYNEQYGIYDEEDDF